MNSLPSLLLLSYLLVISICLSIGAPAGSSQLDMAVKLNALHEVRHPNQHSQSHRQLSTSTTSTFESKPYPTTNNQTQVPSIEQSPTNQVGNYTVALVKNSRNERAVADEANPSSSTLLKHREVRASERQHFCGNTLKEVLKLVCDGKYYGGPTGLKRSTNASAAFNITQLMLSIAHNSANAGPIAENSPAEGVVASSSSALISGSSSSLVEGRAGRNARGIVEECCRKACSVADLRLYCLDSN